MNSEKARAEWSKASGMNVNEKQLHSTPISDPTEELRKDMGGVRRERTSPGIIVILR